MAEEINASLSTLSLDSQNEDWDRSFIFPDAESPLSNSQSSIRPTTNVTPRNSVVFPADNAETPGKTRMMEESARSKRSLSELLRLHAEKGTNVKFSQEEASRVADVLGQWINASSSPYEGEDDFFTRAHDDFFIPLKKAPTQTMEVRPRGQSESANSRPPSSTGFVP